MSIMWHGLIVLLCSSTAFGATFEHEHIRWDTPDETIQATVLDNPDYYDADIALVDDALWLTWLEYQPGQGDRCWVARYEDGKLVGAQASVSQPRALRHPTIDLSIVHPPRLSCEYTSATLEQFKPWRSETRLLSDLSHRVFDGELFIPDKLRWSADGAESSDGTTCVVLDEYDARNSYDVTMQLVGAGKQHTPVKIAQTARFEARPSVAADPDNRFWIAWEEGCENWGMRYVSEHRLRNSQHFKMSDANGPLHRFRRIKMAVVMPNGQVFDIKEELPMPAFDFAAKRENLPHGVRDLGVFYEQPKVAVDIAGRVWVVYRHYYIPYVGQTLVSHQQSPWGVYARCLTDKGWSRLYRFDVGQGDQMQRIEVAPHGDGIAVAWTTGRTDRRENEWPRGVCVATVTCEGNAPGKEMLVARKPIPRMLEMRAMSLPPVNRKATINGKEYEVLFGDLHRHTDLSLCFVPTDGSIEDAYRYGIDVVKHDFLGITDHTRDIAQGDASSLLWWRCMKEVTRYSLEPRFIPFFAYERSRGAEDHNVISLRADMLRPFTYRHEDFWKELDNQTIVIPHQTQCKPFETEGVVPQSISSQTWDVRDDEHRPLLEVYQGCRDRWIESDAHEALARGHRLGFIASSDHVSTAASFACVWVDKRDRKTLFDAMKSRRTYAASDKIRLLVRAGEYWMGDVIESNQWSPLEIDVQGTASIKTIDVIVDGQVEKSFPQTEDTAQVRYTPKPVEPGEHYVYVRVIQTDGNQAWSSPIRLSLSK